MTQPDEEKIIELGGLVLGDLVAITTPDGRFHYGKVSETGEDGDHFLICHHSCSEDQTQFKLEFDALDTASKFGLEKKE